jgi:hypothetical protein
MPPLPNTGRDPPDRNLRRTKPQEKDLDTISRGFPALETTEINLSAQSGFKREVLPEPGKAIQLRPEKTSGGQCSQFRTQRQTSRNEISVYKMDHARVFEEVFASESSLAGTVRAGDDDAQWFLLCTFTSAMAHQAQGYQHSLKW